MIESLQAIRSLGLAPIFESLYFGKDVPESVALYMSYPSVFRESTLAEGGPLTEGGLVPIVDDGNFDNVCLFDPQRQVFVVKLVEEPDQVVTEFASWQQYLAFALLEIVDSGADDDELIELASVTGFKRTNELIALVGEMESLSDQVADQRCERFIESCAT